MTSRPSAQQLWTVPNILSFLRLASVPVFVWLFISDRESAAVVLYAVAAWTDFFDGFIARRTNSVSELGKLLDPLSDRVLIVALAIMLLARDVLPWPIAAAVILRDLLLLSAFPALERRHVPRIPVNVVGKAATGALFFGLTFLAFAEAGFAPALLSDIGSALAVVGTVLYWVAGVMYAREANVKLKALRSERLPT